MQIVEPCIDATIDQLPAHIDSLLDHLGEGTMLSVPYDTAWLVRLSHKFPDHGFNEAVDWLTGAQHADGSWGSQILHYHDRIICTLSSVIALRSFPGNSQFDKRIKSGMHYLHSVMDRTSQDANDTVNFRGIAPFLLGEAAKLGLDVPQIPGYKNDDSGSKLARLKARPDLWPKHPIAHSLECFEPNLPNAAGIIEPDGSVAASPSATIALLLNSDEYSQASFDYLYRWMHHDGGLPDVAPIDLFEINWSLNTLRQANAVSPCHPKIQSCLKHVWSYWDPIHGISPSSALRACDLDDTATAFMVLDWAGYPVQPDVFANYEHDTHFRCFQDETDPSLSAHIRLLLALKTRRDSSQYTSWVEKILKFVRDYQLNHAWTDKWHTSPFYLHSASIPALHAVDDVIASVHLQEVLGSQHSDGGWGYFGSSTLEETAYALQSLLYWHCHVSKIDKQVLTAGVAYLSLNMQKRQPSLWIGKCLYTPSNVVRAAVLSALHMYATL